jgi:hypothetical protein
MNERENFPAHPHDSFAIIGSLRNNNDCNSNDCSSTARYHAGLASILLTGSRRIGDRTLSFDGFPRAQFRTKAA